MKNFLIFVLFLVCMINVQAQTSTNGNFTFTEQGAYNPLDGSTEVGTIDVFGTPLKVYETSKGKRFAHVRGKYFVWSDFEQKGQLPDGTPIYTSPSGTPFIWAMGRNGVYAKYGKAN